MKIALLVIAGLLFSTALASAHPAFTPDCAMLERNKAVVHFTLAFDKPSCTSSRPCLEAIDLNLNPLGLAGETTFTCRADNLGQGPLTIFNFANTNFTCDLGPESAPFAKTQVWQEVINSVGEAVLTCVFPVPTAQPH